MKKNRLKWVLYLGGPLLLFVFPFNGLLNLKQPVAQIILKPQKTGITTLHYHDTVRNRPLTTEVWYPVDLDSPAQKPFGVWERCDEARDAPLSTSKKLYPLILLSHGSGGDRYNISWLAETLAANGYIVAAMDHFGNTWNNRIPEAYARPWERPQDVSFVLDQLLSNSPFQEQIDPNQIGFAGYSLGGATGIWVAGACTHEKNVDIMKETCAREYQGIVTPEIVEGIDFKEACQCFHDKRISAAFVMAPALGWLFSDESLKQIDIPIYIIAPKKDEIVPFEINAKLLAKKIKRASLMMLSEDASHFVFLNRPTLMGKRFLDTKYWKDPEQINREEIHTDLSKRALKFFSQFLGERH